MLRARYFALPKHSGSFQSQYYLIEVSLRKHKVSSCTYHWIVAKATHPISWFEQNIVDYFTNSLTTASLLVTFVFTHSSLIFFSVYAATVLRLPKKFRVEANFKNFGPHSHWIGDQHLVVRRKHSIAKNEREGGLTRMVLVCLACPSGRDFCFVQFSAQGSAVVKF